MVNKKLKINIDADTTEVLKQMREVTEAANECVEALEKLEEVMGKFTNQNETVEIYCNGKVIAQTVIKQTTDSIRYQGSEIIG
ncbi:hypothetical protein ACTFNM_01865 [Bacillus cereus group sp. BCN115]|uniref:hypothetical protein n=1 Tax=Bacillus cereus group sp. BCN115 TaxID=3450575 RepID=UPI003F7A1011|nr:hypothetical protein [Bacillus cereus]MDA2552296.1 hypothetical protein [Bacillus cereus]